MPIYQYSHPEKPLVIEVVQSMSESHVYIDEDGVEWNRVWNSPNASIDTKNDGSKEGFMKYTENKRGTMGDLWEASREASEKRKKERGGVDKVQESYEKGYSKKRKGMKRKGSTGSDSGTISI